MERTRRPNGSTPHPSRSVRVSDETWNRARRRASFDRVTISHVAAQLIEGYAAGLIDLPKVTKTYVPTRQEESA